MKSFSQLDPDRMVWDPVSDQKIECRDENTLIGELLRGQDRTRWWWLSAQTVRGGPFLTLEDGIAGAKSLIRQLQEKLRNAPLEQAIRIELPVKPRGRPAIRNVPPQYRLIRVPDPDHALPNTGTCNGEFWCDPSQKYSARQPRRWPVFTPKHFWDAVEKMDYELYRYLWERAVPSSNDPNTRYIATSTHQLARHFESVQQTIHKAITRLETLRAIVILSVHGEAGTRLIVRSEEEAWLKREQDGYLKFTVRGANRMVPIHILKVHQANEDSPITGLLKSARTLQERYGARLERMNPAPPLCTHFQWEMIEALLNGADPLDLETLFPSEDQPVRSLLRLRNRFAIAARVAEVPIGV